MDVVAAIGFDGGDNQTEMLAVANSVARVVDAIIPGLPPFGDRPITLIRNPGPQVIWIAEDHYASRYRVGLNCAATFWQQMAYQLSHELAHVKMGPARSNLLLEVFAFAVSLESLNRLVYAWQECPPFEWEGWHEYAAALAGYRLLPDTSCRSQLTALIRDDFGIQSAVERSQRLSSVRESVSLLPLGAEESRAWQFASAELLLEQQILSGDRWQDLLSVATRTEPSALLVKEFRTDLSLVPDSVPAWVPYWLR